MIELLRLSRVGTPIALVLAHSHNDPQVTDMNVYIVKVEVARSDNHVAFNMDDYLEVETLVFSSPAKVREYIEDEAGRLEFYMDSVTWAQSDYSGNYHIHTEDERAGKSHRFYSVDKIKVNAEL